jgi:transglutaminase superfamily protein
LRRLAAFLALSREDRRLLLEAFAACVYFRLALYVVSANRLRGLVVRSGRDGSPVERIVWAVRTASRRTPGVTCLVSGLALQRMLGRHGHRSELHIGVSRNGGVFAAHAWVERDGRVLVGEGELDTYVRLVSWKG